MLMHKILGFLIFIYKKSKNTVVLFAPKVAWPRESSSLVSQVKTYPNIVAYLGQLTLDFETIGNDEN